MKSTCRLAATALGLTLVLAACGADPEEPTAPEAQDTATAAVTEDPTDEHADHEDHSTEEEDPHANHGGGHDVDLGSILIQVLGTSTGEFVAVEGASGEEVIEGTAVLETTEAGTSVTVQVAGLLAGNTYASHMHDGSCTDVGGHYQDDPTGPMSPPNEIWASSSSDPSGDLEPNHQGVATGSGSADWVPRLQPLSVQIHAPVFPGLPISCADFAYYDAPATLVLSPQPAHDGDVASIEYALDDGELVAYDGPVELTEPGMYTVRVQGVAADGTPTDPQEAVLIIGGPV